VGDYATSGAGRAIEGFAVGDSDRDGGDSDSLLDFEEMVQSPLRQDLIDYKRQFTPFNERVVQHIQWWWTFSCALLALSVIWGMLGFVLLMLDRVEPEQAAVFVTALLVFVGLSFVGFPVLWVAWFALHRTLCVPPQMPGEVSVKTPDCANTCLHTTLC
jgi:hypothetical protein